MIRRLLAALILFALAGSAGAQDKLTVKTEDAPLPADLAGPIRDLLDAKAFNVYDPKGKLLCTVWPRKTLTSAATADQIKDGLTYRELEETSVVGAVQFPEPWTDYRKQKIKAGVYTLRLGFQPMDGDHQGTAPFNEFCLLAPAKKDEKPGTMHPVELQQMSASAAGGTHPGVMLLFPNPKPAAEPVIEAKPNDAWVLNFQEPVTAGGQKAVLGFSLVVMGHTIAD